MPKVLVSDAIPKYKATDYATVIPNVYENRLFRAEELRPGIYKISQPWFSEEALHVYSFLIVGTTCAIVYDTMFGYGNLRKFCEQITDLPLIAVNSHCHGDHAAGNFDFDCCYIHHYDLPGIYQGFAKTPEAALERAKNAAKPEFRDQIQLSDMCMPKPMYAYPLYDSDLFDIGDRKLQVIHVGGHSPGCIMLIDNKNHVAFSGDTCNNDTIISRSPADSIEEYAVGLRHLRKYTDDVDFLFGGHEDFPATIIDEGIELAERVVNGTDDHMEVSLNLFGRQATVVFGAEMKYLYRRVDDKDMNIQYAPNLVHIQPFTPRVLTADPPRTGRVIEKY